MNIWIWVALFALAALLTFRPRRKMVTWDSALRAIESENLQYLETIPADEGVGRWPERVRLANSAVQVVYFETMRGDTVAVETVDLAVHGQSGGIIMTFENDILVALTKNGTRFQFDAIPNETRVLALQILRVVQNAAGSKGIASV